MEVYYLNNPDLRNLLKIYDQKRLAAEIECENRVNKLYAKNPELSSLVEKINFTSIQISKAILKNHKEETIQLNKTLDELKQKKNNLLHRLNIDDTFFLPKYECNLCDDTGYLVDDDNVMCTCLKQKLIDQQYNKSNIFNLAKENFSTFNEQVYSDQKDEKKYHSDISPRENIRMIKKIAQNFIDHFDNPDEKNLLFTGNTGLGKTFLSNCIASEMIKKGKTVLYQTAPIMLDSVVDYRFGKGDRFIYENILSADLLIIDDLGTESMNSLKFTELFNIINTRLLNQNNKITKTIISTNLSLNNLFTTYDERIFSRLAGYYNICRFYGDDIRLKK